MPKHARPARKRAAQQAITIADAAWLRDPGVRAVFSAIGAGGYEIRAVGGAVRNALLRLPVADVDFATTATPLEAKGLAEAAGLKTVPTGIDHGTITVLAFGQPFEVTTLREDVETDGRRAVVRFGRDWTRDAQRRDFTMNALYADVNGAVFDPLGGIADALAQRVRFIGDARQRIREDYLRTLRFFRFNAQHGRGALDREGLQAAGGERDGLRGLSAERVRSELLKLFAAPGAGRTLRIMMDHGFLVDLLGGPPLLNRFERTTKLETMLGLSPGPMRRLAALALFVEEDAARLAIRLRLSGAERTTLALCVPRADFGLDQRANKARLYHLGEEAYRDVTLLAHAHSGLPLKARKWRDAHDLPQRWTAPAFPLKGGDVVGLGAPKGPIVGRVLQDLERAWIAADFKPDRDDLLQRAKAALEAVSPPVPLNV